MTHVTCRLTAKNRDELRNPTLDNRVWATFLHPRGARSQFSDLAAEDRIDSVSFCGESRLTTSRRECSAGCLTEVISDNINCCFSCWRCQFKPIALCCIIERKVKTHRCIVIVLSRTFTVLRFVVQTLRVSHAGQDIASNHCGCIADNRIPSYSRMHCIPARTSAVREDAVQADLVESAET